MSTTSPSPASIAPAEGKLGVLVIGLGAVTTTLIAGVELAKRGQGQPIGSMTQMGTIRLGKRTDGRSPLVKDFVPLAKLGHRVGCLGCFPRRRLRRRLPRRRAGTGQAHRGNLRSVARHPSDEGCLRAQVRPQPDGRAHDGRYRQARHAERDPRGHQPFPR